MGQRVIIQGAADSNVSQYHDSPQNGLLQIKSGGIPVNVHSFRYLNTMFVKLQGFDGDWQKPIELVYRQLYGRIIA